MLPLKKPPLPKCCTFVHNLKTEILERLYNLAFRLNFLGWQILERISLFLTSKGSKFGFTSKSVNYSEKKLTTLIHNTYQRGNQEEDNCNLGIHLVSNGRA